MPRITQRRDERSIEPLPESPLPQRDGDPLYQIGVSSAAIGLMTRSTMARS